MKRPNKYRAKKVSEDGFLFDSKAEHKRYCELKLLQRAGQIEDLAVHQRFPCYMQGVKVTVYEADFTYFTPDEAFVVEDVKGMKTAVYRLKKKIFEACYPYKITEIGA